MKVGVGEEIWEGILSKSKIQGGHQEFIFDTK
jgi:hypothetical protein